MGIKDRSIEEILKTLDKLAVSPDELEHWTKAIETTAKNLCNDKRGKIKFKYSVNDKSTKFFVKDVNQKIV